MKTTNRLFAAFLALTILITTFPLPALAAAVSDGAMSNIVYATEYTYGQFNDVDENKWYGEGGQQVISTACKLGLMKGNDNGFSPNGTVSLAEAITMAARLHNLYCGDTVTFEQGATWYKVYTDYAIEQGIIFFDDFEDLTVEKPIKGIGAYVDESRVATRAATRAEMAYIFENALPCEELAEINVVVTIPDVDVSTSYADSITLLYHAGVLTGDQTGAFHPESSIERASAAAILARVALPDMRKTVTAEKQDKIKPWNEVYTEGMQVTTLDELKLVYTAAVVRRIDSFEIRTTEEVLNEFYQCGVIFDSNIGKVEYKFSANILCITITYTLFGEVEALGITADAISRSSDKALYYNAQIDAIKDSIITDDMTNREKCKAIHDYMIKTYDYDMTFMAASYSFAGLLDNGVAVCQAYMELFYLLANRADVYCEMLTGQANGNNNGEYVSHGWNLVWIDDAWYHIDVTFDDPIGGGGKIFYDYFLITSEKIAADHTW